MRILKSKWYVAIRVDGCYEVCDTGPFNTEGRALDSTMQLAQQQNINAPSRRLMERRPEWIGVRFTTVKGSRILMHPHIYKVGDIMPLEQAVDEYLDQLADGTFYADGERIDNGRKQQNILV